MILLTFAVTGSTVAYLSKAMVQWMSLNSTDNLWSIIFLKTFIFIFGYQLLILFFGFIFGKFQFFWIYEKKILKRMGFRK